MIHVHRLLAGMEHIVLVEEVGCAWKRHCDVLGWQSRRGGYQKFGDREGDGRKMMLVNGESAASVPDELR